MTHRTTAELDAHMPRIREAPRTAGTLELIVCRPAAGVREVLEVAQLDVERGLVGDSWAVRGSRHTADGSANPEQQITIMCARVLAAVAEPEHWPLAGDQLVVDLDLSAVNAPAGTRLSIGDALLEVTAKPHTGCAKFTARFGSAATAWLNSEEGRALRLRGLNARVLRGGAVRCGDAVLLAQ